MIGSTTKSKTNSSNTIVTCANSIGNYDNSNIYNFSSSDNNNHNSNNSNSNNNNNHIRRLAQSKSMDLDMAININNNNNNNNNNNSNNNNDNKSHSGSNNYSNDSFNFQKISRNGLQKQHSFDQGKLSSSEVKQRLKECVLKKKNNNAPTNPISTSNSINQSEPSNQASSISDDIQFPQPNKSNPYNPYIQQQQSNQIHPHQISANQNHQFPQPTNENEPMKVTNPDDYPIRKTSSLPNLKVRSALKQKALDRRASPLSKKRLKTPFSQCMQPSGPTAASTSINTTCNFTPSDATSSIVNIDQSNPTTMLQKLQQNNGFNSQYQLPLEALFNTPPHLIPQFTSLPNLNLTHSLSALLSSAMSSNNNNNSNLPNRITPFTTTLLDSLARKQPHTNFPLTYNNTPNISPPLLTDTTTLQQPKNNPNPTNVNTNLNSAFTNYKLKTNRVLNRTNSAPLPLGNNNNPSNNHNIPANSPLTNNSIQQALQEHKMLLVKTQLRQKVLNRSINNPTTSNNQYSHQQYPNTPHPHPHLMNIYHNIHQKLQHHPNIDEYDDEFNNSVCTRTLSDSFISNTKGLQKRSLSLDENNNSTSTNQNRHHQNPTINLQHIDSDVYDDKSNVANLKFDNVTINDSSDVGKKVTKSTASSSLSHASNNNNSTSFQFRISSNNNHNNNHNNSGGNNSVNDGGNSNNDSNDNDNSAANGCIKEGSGNNGLHVITNTSNLSSFNIQNNTCNNGTGSMNKLPSPILEEKIMEYSHTTGVVYDVGMLSHRCLCGNEEIHPESSNRLSSVWEKLSQSGVLLRCQLLQGKKASMDDLQMCHEDTYSVLFGTNPANRLKINPQLLMSVEFCRLPCGGIGVDSDTVWNNTHTANAARLAVGCVTELALKVVRGELRNGFALVRPPGHHAEYSHAMGFGYFNNVAVAARKLILQTAVKRVLIVDWDIHHGNGTQQIFYRDPSVLYISLHRHDDGHFFPGTGSISEIGEGQGLHHNINIAWRGTQPMADAEYVCAFQHLVLPVAHDFQPDIILVSAGFDATQQHPVSLGGYRVTSGCFNWMTRVLCESGLAEGRVVLALEGGYDAQSLGECVEACIYGLQQGGSPLKHPGDLTNQKIPISADELNRVPCDAAIEVMYAVAQAHAKHWHSLDMVTRQSLQQSYLTIMANQRQQSQMKGCYDNIPLVAMAELTVNNNNHSYFDTNTPNSQIPTKSPCSSTSSISIDDTNFNTNRNNGSGGGNSKMMECDSVMETGGAGGSQGESKFSSKDEPMEPMELTDK